MIHNEMSFLFGAVPIPGKAAPGSPSDVVKNNNQGNTGDIFGAINKTVYDRVYKDKDYPNDVISYVNDSVYAQDRISKDPYIALLDYFNEKTGGVTTGVGGGGRHGPRSMTLKAADFVYLKDLGVYPINRLIILRRYRDGVVVPNNLSLFQEPPISTVIGWAKADDKSLFDFSFGEKWVEQTDTLDKVIQKIMKEQFGIGTDKFMPIPAWSQGFLFGMLNNMGLSSYDSTHVPTGDPNVLRTSYMREIEQQSLLSELKITFETSYEQKYIDGVDPGLAFQDIIANLVRCGTSEMKFVLNGEDKYGILSHFLNIVQKGGNNENVVTAWIELGQKLVTSFINAIDEMFNGTGVFGSLYAGLNNTVKDENKAAQSDKKMADADAKNRADFQRRLDYDIANNKQGNLDSTIKKLQIEIARIDNRYKPKAEAGEGSVANVTGVEAKKALWTKTKSSFEGIINTVLAGSVYRYRWPLIGSIGVMSGLSTTPWHLTVGNPFSPILNMANIVVNNVDLKFSNEMGFNDMPKRVDATIEIKMGRPLGGQEINRMFNNQYGRIYTKKTAQTQESGTSKKKTWSQMTPEEKAAEDKTAQDEFNNEEKQKNFGTIKSDTYTKSTDDVKAKKAGMMSTADYKILYPIKIGG